MKEPGSGLRVVRFGVFELDLAARELRAQGKRVHLQDKPYELLVALIERPGELVTRETLRRRLWPADTFVAFDDNLNAAVRKVRDALGDSAEAPRFVETVPRHGYRFVAPVSGTSQLAAAAPVEPSVPPAPPPPPIVTRTTSNLRVRTLAAILLIVLAGGYAVDRWPGRRESSGRVMLAVLPLNAIGGGPEHEALTDGLTEGITTAVARLDPDRVAVIARSSVARYQHEVTPVADIGRALNVQYLLQGTVRVMSGRLRVTAQLVEVERESHVWADVYDRDLVDIFAVESEIAETVARRLSGRLLPGGGGSRRQPDSDAHVAYLQGLHFWNRRSEAGLRQAIERFHRAVDRDPGYARAHAGLASAYASLATSADAVPAADARALAEASARRALELDPDLPEGHVVMSAIACRFDWDWHACERGLQRALALDPNYATGRHLLGEHLLQRGRFEAAIAQLTQARTLDPLSPAIHTHLGLAYMYARRPDEALACYAQAIEVDPNYVLAHRVTGLTLVRARRFDEGLAALRRATALAPDSIRVAADLGYALGVAGQIDSARTVLAEVREIARRRQVSAYDFAVLHAGLGESEAALDWLEKAYADRATGLRWLKVESIFDGLRGERRFADLLRRLAIPD